MVQTIDIDGSTMRHGPFRVGDALGTEPRQREIPWPQIAAELAAAETDRRGGAIDPDTLHLIVSESGIARLHFDELPIGLWEGIDLAGHRSA